MRRHIHTHTENSTLLTYLGWIEVMYLGTLYVEG